MARAGGGGGLSVTVSPAGGPVGASGSGGATSGASSHHFEFTGTIGVNRTNANDDGSISISIPNAMVLR